MCYSKFLIQYVQFSYVALAPLKVSINRLFFSATLNPRCCYVDILSLSDSDPIRVLDGMTILFFYFCISNQSTKYSIS